MSKQVMQRALDALERSIDNFPANAQHTAAIAELRAEIDAQEVEPVAWVLTSQLTERKTTTSAYLWFSNPVNCMWTALYTTPPNTEAMRRDAERYRWLRSTTNWVSSKGRRIDVRNCPEVWDESIDAAIAQGAAP